jgi:hypothetical protein
MHRVPGHNAPVGRTARENVANVTHLSRITVEANSFVCIIARSVNLRNAIEAGIPAIVDSLLIPGD